MQNIKEKIKNNILSNIGNLSEFFIDNLSKSINLGFEIYEFNQKIIFSKRSKNFWQSGKLYKLRNEVKLDFFQSLFETGFQLPEIFRSSDMQLLENKENLKDFLQKNFTYRSFLKNEDYFLILQKQYFSFGNCVLQILLKDQVYILILNKDQSKKPWKYFEYDNF